ncbi:MAG: hypothetical protein HOQ22_07695 [Nocardioidaceae bacterium]|nr:hypothetical protein [Nocardioidaceae bacterium]NUS50908.1 hypothetical protein [Nocardioidaceae bacterium]
MYATKPVKAGAAALLTAAMVVGGTAAPAQAAPPANDSFAAAAALTGTFGTVRGNTLEATREVGEPDHAGVLSNRSVWYRWTASTAGPVVFTTTSSVEELPTFDTVLAVYRGDAVGQLTPVASNDDRNRFDPTSRVRFDAEAGVTYQVAVDSVAGKTGRFRLSWGMRAPNDDFAASVKLTGSSGTTTTSTFLATSEAGEATWHRRSVWYRWTAPRSGALVVTTTGSLYDTVLGVYQGRSLATVRLLRRNDDFFGLASRVRLPVVQGRTYRVVAGGLPGQDGFTQVSWRMP